MIQNHIGLAAPLCIAFKKYAALVVDETHHKRVVVFGSARIAIPEFRRENRRVESLPVKAIARVELPYGDAKRLCFSQQGTHCWSLTGLNTDPQLTGSQVPQNRRHAAHVIAVCMSKHHGIKTSNVT